MFVGQVFTIIDSPPGYPYPYISRIIAGMNESFAYLNGRWISASEAAVPVGDAGFVLGVTVAEQLRTFAGKIFRLEGHLERLAHSLEIVGVDPGMGIEELGRIGEELVARNHPLLPPGGDLGLSMVITPGGYPVYTPPGPKRPTVCLHTYPLPFHRWAEKYRTGQALATTGIEQVSERCWPASLKCRSRMHYYLADRAAAAVDPQARALLLDSRGYVTEASSANIVIYREGEGLLSPPWSKVLHGITMMTTLELAERLKIPSSQRELTIDDVASADEAMLTSTTISILPVTRLNGRPIGSGGPGAIYRRLLAAWSELVGMDIVAQAEEQAERAR
jgi:branched-chain amino acid aminotransferase